MMRSGLLSLQQRKCICLFLSEAKVAADDILLPNPAVLSSLAFTCSLHAETFAKAFFPDRMPKSQAMAIFLPLFTNLCICRKSLSDCLDSHVHGFTCDLRYALILLSFSCRQSISGATCSHSHPFPSSA